jgi:hypothetical protein
MNSLRQAAKMARIILHVFTTYHEKGLTDGDVENAKDALADLDKALAEELDHLCDKPTEHQIQIHGDIKNVPLAPHKPVEFAYVSELRTRLHQMRNLQDYGEVGIASKERIAGYNAAVEEVLEHLKDMGLDDD